MDSTEGFIYTVLERVKGNLDDSDLEAKYSDDYLVRHIVMPAMQSVYSRVMSTSSQLVMIRYSFPLVQGTNRYTLPANVGEVWRIAVVDSSGNVTGEAYPRGLYHPNGPNWKVEGNQIVFLPFVDQSESACELWYTPSGDFHPVYSAAMTLDAGKTTLTVDVSVSPAVGVYDRRENAYAGHIVRLLPSSGVVEERVVESWLRTSGTTWVATVRDAFDEATAGTVTGEFCPSGVQSFVEAISLASAIKLAPYKKVTANHYKMLVDQYRDAMKTTLDLLGNMQMRTAKSFERLTVDNQLVNARSL